MTMTDVQRGRAASREWVRFQGFDNYSRWHLPQTSTMSLCGLKFEVVSEITTHPPNKWICGNCQILSMVGAKV